ncbi:MAG TPA: exodeoxyribonuclease III, partial [Opitutae bacterium]|nr:exodeoxyribonuclease III [Opitutae bacterium]
RTQEWDVDFLAFVNALEMNKPVIFCGDLNVAHTEVDLANPKTNRKNAGFTDEERAGFDAMVSAGFIDSFRQIHPNETERYSWWSYRAAARQRNIGWRIDYFCVSSTLEGEIADADILPEVLGSDHCPVSLKLK